MASAAPPPATATAAATLRSTASMTCVAVAEGGIDASRQRARVLTCPLCSACSQRFPAALRRDRALFRLFASVLLAASSRNNLEPRRP